jgi:hypothetical protein
MVLLALVASVAIACGGDDDGGGTNGDAGLPDGALADGELPDGARPDGFMCDEFTPGCIREFPMVPIPLNELCNTFVSLFCRANDFCCTNDAERYPTRAACEVEQFSRCMDPVDGIIIEAAVASGQILYNQANAGATLARVGPDVDGCEPVDLDAQILSVMTGTVASGSDCTPLACSTGLSCVAGSGTATCQTVSAGSTCDSNMRCGRRTDLYCNGGMCASLGGTGDTCSSDEGCASRTCAGGTCGAYDTDAAYCVRQGRTGGRPFSR